MTFEFAAGVVICIGLGVVLLSTLGWPWALLGLWLVGIGLNYVPLTLYALGGAAEPDEVSAADRRAERRRYGWAQLWILVPGAVLVAAVAESWSQFS